MLPKPPVPPLLSVGRVYETERVTQGPISPLPSRPCYVFIEAGWGPAKASAVLYRA